MSRVDYPPEHRIFVGPTRRDARPNRRTRGIVRTTGGTRTATPVRFHGVLGPRSSWRALVVPKAPQPSVGHAPIPTPPPCPRSSRVPTTRPPPRPSITPPRALPQPDPHPREGALPTTSGAEVSPALVRATLPASNPPSSSWSWITPNVLAIAHWSRLLAGLLYATTPRLDWATLLRRSFEVDVLRCARCGGRLRIPGEVLHPSLVTLVLESLGLPAQAPQPARARDPTQLLGDDAPID